MTALGPDEQAAIQRHADRVDELRRRGWGRTPPITRSDVADFTLDRALLKAAGHPKYKEQGRA